MSASVADRVEVRLAPSDSDARGDAVSHHRHAADPHVQSTREALGLAQWRGAATGHQPIFWHGGILAKAMCAAALSRAQGHGWLHLVADHDAVDPCALPYPARRDGHALRVATAHLGPPAPAGVAASALQASPARPPERACHAPPADADVADRLARAAAALSAADASRGAAWRTADANFSLLSSMGALERPSHVILASSLLCTPLGRACVERIAGDPEACARAFNDALAHAPRAASRLRVSGDASEVPLWELADTGVRTRIDGRRLRALLRDGALDLRGDPPLPRDAAARATDPARLAGTCPLLPRAFLATGIVRALGIHMVHGTGGEAYERAGDLWWRTALGQALPPFSVATADLRFTPASLGLRAADDTRTLTWREAWVDPARLDGLARDPVRAQALQRIASFPRGSAERRRAFAQMRVRVEALRAERRTELDALSRDEQARGDALASRAAATDRTYPAVLHDADALAALAELVAGAVSGSESCSGARGSRR